MFTRLPQRFAIEAKDQFRHNRAVRRLTASVYAAMADRGTEPSQCAQAIVKLSKSARLAGSDKQMIRMEQAIHQRIRTLAGRPVDWSALDPGWKSDRIEHGVVLKPHCGDNEPGVILISFEYQWMRLFHIPNLREFARRYTLVLSPTWSPPHCPGVCLFPPLYPGRIVSLISHTDDLRILPRLSPNITVVPLYASSWVQPDLYSPVPFARKGIDLVMVANFSEYKRHFALFRALRDMPRSTRVLLVGRPLANRGADVLRREAAAWGVQDRFELMENASEKQVNAALAGAKVSVILSRQEGSCVVVVESMFADTPVGLLSDAHIGSRAFIAPQTGRFLEHEDLGRQLQDFIEHAGEYSPRRWAIENGISCFGSTQMLNEFLKKQALTAGQAWTRDIVPHHWRPNPELVSPADRARFQPEYDDFFERFGIHLGLA
ncbi:MAG TPA: glycosyltransferase [Bryobacteraceae bacterium]|nr:glycosyltransferase [Bryobacteraceae bacterium]